MATRRAKQFLADFPKHTTTIRNALPGLHCHWTPVRLPTHSPTHPFLFRSAAPPVAKSAFRSQRVTTRVSISPGTPSRKTRTGLTQRGRASSKYPPVPPPRPALPPGRARTLVLRAKRSRTRFSLSPRDARTVRNDDRVPAWLFFPSRGALLAYVYGR